MSRVSNSESHLQAESSEFEVGSAFCVKYLDPTAVETRSQIIAATSQYLAKLYEAGHITDNSIVNFFNKISTIHNQN